ncbi:hypothetical protein BUE80_DR006721, partial [Diplocarpon rosae]
VTTNYTREPYEASSIWTVPQPSRTWDRVAVQPSESPPRRLQPHNIFLSDDPPSQTAKMMFFAFGNLIYISVLLVNAIAILSEDRFLARGT